MMRVATRIVLLAIGPALLAACQPALKEADIIFSNGAVYTANAAHDVADVVVIDDGKIVAVGGADLLKTYTAPKAIDLKGRLLIPGFNDAHTHIMSNPRSFVDVSSAKSIAELQTLVGDMTKTVEPGAWITGYGWSEVKMSDGRKPNRRDLDAVAPNNPVFLTREGSHAGLANSAALKIAGLDAKTPKPEVGELEKDAKGELTGVINEAAGLVMRYVPPTPPDELVESLARNLNHQLSFGITSLTNATTGPEGYKTMWQRAYSESSLPLPRSTVQINPGLRAGDPQAAVKRLKDFGLVTGAGDDRLKVGPLKIFVDGAFSGVGAYTNRPYRSDPKQFGALVAPISDIEVVSRAAHAMGWQFGFHTIGDAAIEQTVDLFDRILADAPRADHRHYLNHFTVMPSKATMEKMQRDGIAIAQQPNFTYVLEGLFRTHLWDEALRSNDPVGTPLKMGIQMAFSSDIIPVGPLVGIYGAVTRKGISGEVYGPEEGVDIKEALRLYTYGGAWLNFDDDIKGTIEPGKLADLVVLNENLFEAPPERILETKVDMTVLDGKVVYERPAS
jgi:predicted amidohydrolase YtcJ